MPYTTEMLLEKAIEGLGEYDDDWNDTAGSNRNLASNELSISLRKSKFRFRHAPTGTCYLKVWYRTKFTPVSGDVVYGELQTYTWTGSGNPCIPDESKPATHEDNYIYDNESGTEIPIPEENGTTTIEIVKYSCLPGYTPSDESPVNGYPSPAA